jgi:hypothetical protein
MHLPFTVLPEAHGAPKAAPPTLLCRPYLEPHALFWVALTVYPQSVATPRGWETFHGLAARTDL